MRMSSKLSFTESLMTYALGRRVEPSTCRRCGRSSRDAGTNDDRISSFILGVVKSAAFQRSKRDESPLETTAEAERQ